jgi:hypothetical protein
MDSDSASTESLTMSQERPTEISQFMHAISWQIYYLQLQIWDMAQRQQSFVVPGHVDSAAVSFTSCVPFVFNFMYLR